MTASIKQIWNDPVGSKLIAGAIQALIVAVFIPPLYMAWENFGGWPAILLTVGVVAVVGIVFFLFWKVRNRSEPKIELVSAVDVILDEGAPGFPLKCYAQLRNDGAECADVRIIN